MLFKKIDALLRDWFGQSDAAFLKSANEDYEESKRILIALKTLFEKELALRESEEIRDRNGKGS